METETISNEYSTGQDYLIQNMGLEKIFKTIRRTILTVCTF